MKIKTRDMVMVSLFAALTAVGAIIPGIPLGPVPITLQTLFTALAGVILGSRLGMLSQLLYVFIGLIGIPVFTGFTGGVSAITKPSFGYLIGFIVGAYVIGRITESKKEINFLRLFLGVLAGYSVIYIIGIPYMYLILNKVMHVTTSFSKALKIGLILFIPGDIVKCIITALVGTKIVPLIINRK